MDWHECVHPVVASPLLEAPSAETSTVGCPLAHHHNACRKVQVPMSVLTTSGPFRSLHEATPTSWCSTIASVVGPTCSPSLPLSSPRRVQPISW